MDEITSEEFKQKGNECVKEKKFEEAVHNYSLGLRISPNDHLLYSNRSFAYFNLKKFYYALCDSDRVIELKPDFVKGYFRKAEVLKETLQYDEALINYGRALKLEPTNSIIINNFKLAARLCSREMMLEKNVPWVASGVGLITGKFIHNNPYDVQT
jgi:tetratricopeptide (TPR) repeat protein